MHAARVFHGKCVNSIILYLPFDTALLDIFYGRCGNETVRLMQLVGVQMVNAVGAQIHRIESAGLDLFDHDALSDLPVDIESYSRKRTFQGGKGYKI